jgi:SAM-dependent methyltransferase
MLQPKETRPAASPVGLYDANYGHFDEDTYRAIRRDTWGDDFGQNGWITAAEQDRLIDHLAAGRGQRLLDIACGSGGPTLRLASLTGATVVGVDLHADAIAAARRQAVEQGLARIASFHIADAACALPLDDESFDALICIDAINHLADRAKVLAHWRRVLKPGGRLLFTDPVVVTGPVSAEEFAVRSSIGYFLFLPPSINEKLLAETGFRLQRTEDLTAAVEHIASRWHAARQSRSADLIRIEGQTQFDGQQRFLRTTAKLAHDRRLARLAYIALRED